LRAVAIASVGLGTRSLRTARAVAEALFSSEQGPPPHARLDWLTRDVDDFVAHAGSRARLLFRLSLFVVALVAPLLIGRLTRLSRLTVDERAEALDRFERSPVGPALLAVKAILCVLYYEHPDAAREIGFDGSCARTGEA